MLKNKKHKKMAITSELAFGIAVFAAVAGILGIILASIWKSDNSSGASSSATGAGTQSDFLAYDAKTLATVNEVDGSLTFTAPPSIETNNTARDVVANTIVKYQFPKKSPDVGDTMVIADVSGAMVFRSAGNVQGPSSSTVNRIAIFDNTTGDKLLNSSVVIDPTGNVTGVAGLTAASTVTAAGLAVTGKYTLPADDGVANQFVQTDGAGVLSWNTPSGSGDMTGPGSATDKAVVIFNGESGTSTQNSTTTIDGDDMKVVGSVSAASLVVEGQFTLPIADGAASTVMQTDGGGVVTWVPLPGGGDVSTVGTVTTNNAISRYNGTTATEIKETLTSIDDEGTVVMKASATQEEAKLQLLNGKTSAIAIADVVGTIDILGPYSGNPNETHTAAFIHCDATEAWTDTDNGTVLVLGVANGSGSVLPALRIGSGGDNGLVGGLWIENNQAGVSDTSAILTLTSTTQGLLPPRMTEAQRDAIATPVAGLMVFVTDTINSLSFYNGSAWKVVSTV
jgi:hypothetical protein